MFLGLLDCVWLLRFLQPEQIFLNHLVTVLWWIAAAPFAQQMFLVAFATIQTYMDAES